MLIKNNVNISIFKKIFSLEKKSAKFIKSVT